MDWIIIWLICILTICFIGIVLCYNEAVKDIKKLENNCFVGFYKIYKDIKYDILGVSLLSFMFGFLIFYLLILNS